MMHGREGRYSMAIYAQDLAAVHSSGFVGLARAAAEELTARLPPGSRVIAVGEVLGYLGGDATSDGLLGPVVERAAAMLRPGGLLMFDLAAPGRAAGSVQRGWTEGPGWAAGGSGVVRSFIGCGCTTRTRCWSCWVILGSRRASCRTATPVSGCHPG